jgi:hypothetical protein
MKTIERCIAILTAGCALLAPSIVLGADGWATLKGRFVYDGAPPAVKHLATSGKDAAVCDKHKIPDESLIIDPASKGVANIVVFARKTSRVHDSQIKPKADEVEFDQKDCVFLSHVLPMRVDQTLVVKNSDPIGHNTNISPLTDTSINPLLAGGGELKHKFNRQQALPIPVTCNIHPWMKAYILPRDDFYVAVTVEDGSFEIADLPAGEEIEFQAWHEKGAGAGGGLEAKKDWKRGRFKLQLKVGEIKDLGTIDLGSRAFK